MSLANDCHAAPGAYGALAAPPRAPNAAENSAVTIVEHAWVLFLNHRNTALGVVVGMLLLGLLATFLATPQYTSTTRLEVLPDAPIATSVEGEREQSLINEISFYNTQYSLLKSETLAERVARAGRLATDEDFLAAYGIENSEGAMTSAERQTRSRRVKDILFDALDIVPLRNSSLVDVRFTTPSPQLSAKLANLWGQQFLQVTIDRRFAATSDARRYLESRLETLRRNLETSERALINYGTNKGIVTIASRTDERGRTQSQTLVGADIVSISQALAKAREDRIAAESQLANTLTGSAVFNSATVGNLRQKKAELEADLQKQLTIFADDYPSVTALRAQIATLDRNIAAETSRSARGNQEAYEAAVKRERDMQAEMDELTSKYNTQQRESIEMAILQREVDSNRQLYDGLLQRYKEIGVAGVGTNNISVVDRAQTAENPSSPNLLLNIALSLVAGCLLAGGLIFILEKIDNSVRDPQDVVPRFGLPLLGTIPEEGDQPVPEVILDKKSPVYEAYFSLMTNLSFLTPNGVPQTLMLTSSRPKEGKSTSSLCLATVLAGTGKSVILVDADVRNPSQDQYLDIPKGQRGLTHYLAGDDNIDEMILPVTKHGFSLVTAGKVPPNAAELLGSDRLDLLVALLKERYDHVLIDSAPLLGLADAPLIARRVEGVVFTIEANSTRTRMIETSLMRLRMSGARLFGAIVTKVGVRNQAYSYGYGYGSGYRYGSNEAAE